MRALFSSAQEVVLKRTTSPPTIGSQMQSDAVSKLGTLTCFAYLSSRTVPPSPTAVERTGRLVPWLFCLTHLGPQLVGCLKDLSDNSVKEVLDILEALPSKSTDVEKFLEQVACFAGVSRSSSFHAAFCACLLVRAHESSTTLRNTRACGNLQINTLVENCLDQGISCTGNELALAVRKFGD